MIYLSSVSLVVLLVMPLSLLAEEVRVSCSNVADAAERLACFDRTFPSDARVGGLMSEVVPIQAPAQTPVQDSVKTKPVREMQQAAAESKQPPPISDGGMFSNKAKVNISSRLKSVRDKEKQKMIFLLENDQMWIQNSPRSLPFSAGQEVSIKSGTVGGYSLSNGAGVSTRVSRIK